MITCPKCFKENQDHYKFCLGCGAELPREATPKKFGTGTPPQGVPAVTGGSAQAARAANVPTDDATLQGGGGGARARAAGSSAPAASPAPAGSQAVATPPAFAAPPMMAPERPTAAAPPPQLAVPGGSITCPQCEHPNPSNNKFCASCGFKLARLSAVETPAAAPVAPSTAAASGVVLTALRADGSEAGTYALPAGNATIGRDTGAIFAGDSYLSPRHATFSPRGGKLFVHDDSSLNGVYKKLRKDEPVLLQLGEIFRIGQEILRYEPLATMATTPDGVERLGSPSKDYIGRIALVIGRDATGNAYPVPNTGIHLGRERGDVLFPEDGYVSGLHCRLAPQSGQLYLTDLGSSNGTFIRVQGEAEVVNGDILLMGQQLFRISM